MISPPSELQRQNYREELRRFRHRLRKPAPDHLTGEELEVQLDLLECYANVSYSSPETRACRLAAVAERLAREVALYRRETVKKTSDD